MTKKFIYTKGTKVKLLGVFKKFGIAIITEVLSAGNVLLYDVDLVNPTEKYKGFMLLESGFEPLSDYPFYDELIGEKDERKI